MSEENNIIKSLESKGVEIIKSRSELDKIVDIEILKSGNIEMSQAIKADYDCILCFDTPTYNSNYLAEELFKVLDDLIKNFTLLEYYSLFGEKSIITFQEFEFIKYRMKIQIEKNIKFLYCQDEVIYQNIFDDYFKLQKEHLNIDTNNILLPVVMYVSKKKDDIFIDYETISTLSKLNIIKYIFFSCMQTKS